MALTWRREAGSHTLIAKPVDDLMVSIYPLPAGSPATADTKRWEINVRWQMHPVVFKAHSSEQEAIDNAERVTAHALDGLVMQLVEAREEVTR